MKTLTSQDLARVVGGNARLFNPRIPPSKIPGFPPPRPNEPLWQPTPRGIKIP